MITFLEGVVVEKVPAQVVMNVGGVGYELFIPLSTFDHLPGAGTPCRILVYDHVREDAHQLFGFATETERRMFVMLMGVTGIGPKLALSVLSGLSVGEIRSAVVQGDIQRLSSVSGIGRKTAERIVVELKDRIGTGEGLEAVAGERVFAENAKTRDAILAMMALGHKQEVARKKVTAVVGAGSETKLTVEEIIRRALNS